MSAEPADDGWTLASFEVRCDGHAATVPPFTPYLLDRSLPGRLRRICRDCAQDAETRIEGLASGASSCGWCGETPPENEPWTTVRVATAVSRACLECWSKWDQGLPIGRAAS